MRIYILTIFYITWLQIFSATAGQSTQSDHSKNSITSYSMLKYIYSMGSSIFKNRIFLGYIVGLPILPSQFLYNHKENCRIVNNACVKNKFDKINIYSENLQMKAIVCYPPDWNKNNKSKCTLFYNPNGRLISNFINTSNYNVEQNSIIEELLKNGPVILYDHPNTGINHDVNKGILTNYMPILGSTTENQIIDYGELAIKYASENFDQVYVVGMSLGGGVGTISLERYLSKNENIDRNKFKLINIDSFTSIPRVILPKHLTIADNLGWLSGVNMNAQAAIKSLIDQEVDILVFNHHYDDVIPAEARMSNFTKNYTKKNIKTVYSISFSEHCQFDSDLTSLLKYCFNPDADYSLTFSSENLPAADNIIVSADGSYSFIIVNADGFYSFGSRADFKDSTQGDFRIGNHIIKVKGSGDDAVIQADISLSILKSNDSGDDTVIQGDNSKDERVPNSVS